MKQKSSLFRNFYGIFYAGAILVCLQVRRAGGTISSTSCYTFCEDLFDDGVFGIDFTPVWRFVVSDVCAEKILCQKTQQLLKIKRFSLLLNTD